MMDIKIDIEQGFTCFENGLKHEFEMNKLHVITGLNGSGKTQLLKYIASLCIKNKEYANNYNKNNVVLKINTKTEITEERYRRERWEYNRDRDTVDNLINDILDALNRYENTEWEYKQDLYNALFDSANYLFRYRTKIIELFCKRIEQKYNIAKDELQKAFGVVTDSEVTQYFKDKYTEDFKKENNKERVKGKENKKKLESYLKDKLDQIPKTEKQTYINEKNKEILSSKNYKIQDEITLKDMLADWISPFKPNRLLQDLAKIIENDQKTNKKPKSLIHNKINAVLDKQEAFRYRLNPPSVITGYELNFCKKGKQNQHIHFEQLSTGEKAVFELLCYKYILEDDSENIHKPKLFLLDEFDANLNPALTKMYLEVVRQLVEKNVTVFLTTHSPSTVVTLTENEKLYWLENDLQPLEKMEVVRKLAPDFIWREEIKEILFLTDKVEKPFIVFCEGKTDVVHFEKACEILGSNYKDKFHFYDCEGAGNIGVLIYMLAKSEITAKHYQDKHLIALWDFDTTGVKEITNTNDTRGFIKHGTLADKIGKKQNLIFKSKNSKHPNTYLMLLTPKSEIEGYWEQKDQNYTVEHLYPYEILKYEEGKVQIMGNDNDKIEKEPWTITIDSGKKTEFSNRINKKNDLTEKDFACFKRQLDIMSSQNSSN